MTAEQIPKKLGSGGLGLAWGQAPTDLKKLLFKFFDLISAVNVRLDAMQVALDALVTAYNNHRGSAGVHKDADATNVISATAATTIATDILTLVNELKVDYNGHCQKLDSVHGAADETNVVSSADATDEATAVTLVNEIKTDYEAHRILTTDSVHGAADTTNTVSSDDATDWDSVVTLANELKADLNAHRVLTAGSVHGAEDTVNVVESADCGAQITALYTELNEIKADYNLHTAAVDYHTKAGATESTADATTEATAVALVNALKATLNTHLADADVHLDADVLTVAADDATEYEDILTPTAEVRADYTAHLAKSSVHTIADAGNAGSALGTGGAVTVADYLSKES